MKYNTYPFVKWAGGKRQLLPWIKDKLPDRFNRYFEPFVGGGAVIFELQPHNAIINDKNVGLINSYFKIRDYPKEFMEILDQLDAELIKNSDKNDYYYRMRDLYNLKLDMKTFDIEMAALFVFLNKHCYNGLYRVNKKGFFNVPYNGGIASSYDKDNIACISLYLNSSVNIRLGDFQVACRDANEGDFIFIDSPYAPLNDTSFTNYTNDGFNINNHKRLADLFKELTNRGCYCMLTNHDTDLIRELYIEYNIYTIPVRRSINSDPSKRNGIEVIITNYNSLKNNPVFFFSR